MTDVTKSYLPATGPGDNLTERGQHMASLSDTGDRRLFYKKPSKTKTGKKNVGTVLNARYPRSGHFHFLNTCRCTVFCWRSRTSRSKTVFGEASGIISFISRCSLRVTISQGIQKHGNHQPAAHCFSFFPAPIIFALLLNEMRHLRYKKIRADRVIPPAFYFMGGARRNSERSCFRHRGES